MCSDYTQQKATVFAVAFALCFGWFGLIRVNAYQYLNCSVK